MAVQVQDAVAGADEQRALRSVVTAIADTFGPDYYQQQVDHDGNCAELWNTLLAVRP
jgi:hypothetical protein